MALSHIGGDGSRNQAREARLRHPDRLRDGDLSQFETRDGKGDGTIVQKLGMIKSMLKMDYFTDEENDDPFGSESDESDF